MKIVDLLKMHDVFRACGVGMDKLEEVIEREIDIMKSLSHPCVIGFDDNFRINNTIFMVMEMVTGRDLLSALPSTGFSEDLAKQLYFQICCAVAYCHTQNVFFVFLFAFHLSLFQFPFSSFPNNSSFR